MRGLMRAVVVFRGTEVVAGCTVETLVTDMVDVVVFKATVVVFPNGAIEVVMGRPVVASPRPQAEVVASIVTMLVVVNVMVVVYVVVLDSEIDVTTVPGGPAVVEAGGADEVHAYWREDPR